MATAKTESSRIAPSVPILWVLVAFACLLRPAYGDVAPRVLLDEGVKLDETAKRYEIDAAEFDRNLPAKQAALEQLRERRIAEHRDRPVSARERENLDAYIAALGNTERYRSLANVSELAAVARACLQLPECRDKTGLRLKLYQTATASLQSVLDAPRWPSSCFGQPHQAATLYYTLHDQVEADKGDRRLVTEAEKFEKACKAYFACDSTVAALGLVNENDSDVPVLTTLNQTAWNTDVVCRTENRDLTVSQGNAAREIFGSANAAAFWQDGIGDLVLPGPGSTEIRMLCETRRTDWQALAKIQKDVPNRDVDMFDLAIGMNLQDTGAATSDRQSVITVEMPGKPFIGKSVTRIYRRAN
jgi:hypothetical protein